MTTWDANVLTYLATKDLIGVEIDIVRKTHVGPGQTTTAWLTEMMKLFRRPQVSDNW